MEQKKGYSLDAQVRDDRDYAERLGYRVAYVVREVGSGRDPNRPKMLHLLQLAEQRKFDVLVVWRRNRFGRSSDNNPIMDRFLANCGVRVESISVGPQAVTSYTRFQTRIMDAVDELELDSITERCVMGRLEAARQGRWPTMPPTGLKRNHPKKDLVIDEEAAARILAGFEACAAGARIRDLVRIMGLSHHSNVLDKLHNPAYIGEAVYNGIVVPVPQIVPRAVWDRAHAALASRKKNHNDEAPNPTPRFGYLGREASGGGSDAPRASPGR